LPDSAGYPEVRSTIEVTALKRAERSKRSCRRHKGRAIGRSQIVAGQKLVLDRLRRICRILTVRPVNIEDTDSVN
jgi:hypothetical protein